MFMFFSTGCKKKEIPVWTEEQTWEYAEHAVFFAVLNYGWEHNLNLKTMENAVEVEEVTIDPDKPNWRYAKGRVHIIDYYGRDMYGSKFEEMDRTVRFSIAFVYREKFMSDYSVSAMIVVSIPDPYERSMHITLNEDQLHEFIFKDAEE